MPDFSLELAVDGSVVGIDEAGRGPWAGPVVAGAALLDRAALSPDLAERLDDSKKLGEAKRAALFEALQADPAARLGVGVASVEEIDRLNILQATFLAMRRAYEDLGVAAALALIDGNKVPPEWPCPARAVVKGDGLSVSIAAASIVAKVTRDRMMADLGRAHPGYGWERNAGYGTREHQEAIASLGLTPHHRRSYAPIRKILQGV